MSLRDRLGINAHQLAPDQWHRLASLGCRMARVDGNWKDLESAPGVFTFDWLDAILDAAQRYQLEVYCSLGHCPPWISPDAGTLPPLDAWQHHCLAVAQHFKGRVRHWGCWNEVSWRPSEYVQRVLAPMHTCFKRIDPACHIWGPDCATESGWPAWLDTCLRLGRDYLDGVSVHGYKDTAQEIVNLLYRDRPSWIPAWFPWPVPSVQQIMRAAGMGERPLALTEVGWDSRKVGEAKQAEEFHNFLQWLTRDPRLTAAFWFQLSDEPTGGFGLLAEDWQAKPAGEVLQRATGGRSRV